MHLEAMEKGSSFVFKEENLHHNCFEQIKELWEQRLLCDINLMVHNQDDKPVLSISSHKLLLAASVPYFKAMLTSTMKESGCSEIILRDVDPNGLKLIVGYLYSSCLELTEENAQGVLSTANLLGLSSVVSTCERYIMKHISPANCLGLIKFAQMFSLSDLISTAMKFRLQHFAQISREDEFLELAFKEVEELVSNDQIAVDSEEDVYHAVTMWIECNKEREQYLVKLFNHVRFPILPLSFLEHVVALNPLLAVSELKVMIQEALDYHENPASVILFSNPKKIQPRSSVMGVICLVGGSGDSGQSLMDVSFFNPHEKKWRMGPKMLQHRTRLALALFKGELYAIGGSDITESLSSVEKYSPTTNSWKMVSPLNLPRRSCAAIVTPFGIYVLGGYSGFAYLHSMELYHAVEDEWTYQPTMTTARSDLCAVYFNQRIYAIGGVNSKEELRSVERFDILNRKWETISSMYTPRANAAAALLGQEIFVAGGQACKEIINDAEVYNPQINQWEQIVCRMDSPRVGLAMVSIGNLIYVMGGSDGSAYLNSVECYDPSQLRWVHVTELPTVRFGAAACALSKRDHIAPECTSPTQ